MLKTRIRLTLMTLICPFALLGKTKELNNPPAWFWGCWVVSKPLSTPGVSGISPEQTRGIVGTRIVYQRKYAQSKHRVALSPQYATTVLSGDDFLSLGHVRLSQIGIEGDEVTRIQLTKPAISDLDFPGSDVFLRKADIVIGVEKAYFVAQRANVKDEGCKSRAPGSRRNNY